MGFAKGEPSMEKSIAKEMIEQIEDTWADAKRGIEILEARGHSQTKELKKELSKLMVEDLDEAEDARDKEVNEDSPQREGYQGFNKRNAFVTKLNKLLKE
ncbi:MAG: hypothetical protein ABH833_02505 [Parcubacteria group bacterium]